MSVTLPDDILHMICVELWHQRDFNTLYSCAVASRQLATAALVNLYRMHNVAPVTNGGGDTTETAQQEQTVRKWASLWRSIIASSMDQTLYPYCHSIRALDLRDLLYLFDESRFRGAIEKQFFAGPLSRFKVEMDNTPRKPTAAKGRALKRLNVGAVVDAVGEVMTQGTPILEELSGDISGSALSRWAARLPRLQTLVLWRGAALSEGAETTIHDHCPHFKRLTIYECQGNDADEKLAVFLRSLRPETMEHFEIISYSDIATDSYTALGHHSHSLKELRLSNLKAESLAALPMLTECRSIETLYLEDLTGTVDLEATQNDVFLGIVDWLRHCTFLQNITLRKFVSGAALLTPMLLERDVRLRTIEVQNYKLVDGGKAFHTALTNQTALESVHLRPDAEEMSTAEIGVLVDSLGQLSSSLRDLKLIDISESFHESHIRSLARNLPHLTEFWTSGYGISDAIWPDVQTVEQLKTLYFSAVTRFSLEALLEFIYSLKSPGNHGFALSIMNADPDHVLSEDEQSLLRETIREKVDGRFEFVPLRDPAISEFEDDDSD